LNPLFFVMGTKNTLDTIEELLVPIIDGAGYELVDLKIIPGSSRATLQIMIDREGGINIDECARLSREIAPHLEVADSFGGAFNLEVGSPGVRRPLKKREDFERFKGQRVDLKSRERVDGLRRFKGINEGLDESGRVVVQTDEGRVELDLDNIDQARLDPEIEIGSGKNKPGHGKKS
jgi:ribosome maturation factor RimP